ncbi:MAG: D-alanyl-D-alanine carboxypeptidase [bacterium]
MGIAVRPLDRDTHVFALCPDSALMPASNLKVLVTAAALLDWDSSLVYHLDSLLARSKTPLHRRLRADSSFAESLGAVDRPDLRGSRYLVLANRKSDNEVANWLLAALARRAGRTPQSALELALSRLGAPAAGLAVADGCGLSRRNRTTPATLVAALARTRRSPAGAAFLSSLAEPGGIGTLRRRRFIYPHTLRAKTGFINGVFALSGYLDAPHETYVFSFLLNDCPSGTQAYRLFDALLADVYLWDAARAMGGNSPEN